MNKPDASEVAPMSKLTGDLSEAEFMKAIAIQDAKIDLLRSLDYKFRFDPKMPGLNEWKPPATAAPFDASSASEAVDHAWAHAVRRTLDKAGIPEGQFDTMTPPEQAALMSQHLEQLDSQDIAEGFKPW